MRWVTRIFLCCCGPEPDLAPKTATVSSETTNKNEKVSSKTINKNEKVSSEKQNEKKKKDRIPKKVRDAVWLKYHGNKDVGVCYCCGKDIQRYNAGWHCSHIVADIHGGEEITDNLTTCCPHCNLSMGPTNLYVYMKTHNMQGPGRKYMDDYLHNHPNQK